MIWDNLPRLVGFETYWSFKIGSDMSHQEINSLLFFLEQTVHCCPWESGVLTFGFQKLFQTHMQDVLVVSVNRSILTWQQCILKQEKR